MSQTAFAPRLLANKVAFLAGGGRAASISGVAEGFAEAGAKVALTSSSQDKIETAARALNNAGHEAFELVADVRDFAAIELALAETKGRYGAINIVLSGAARNFLAPAKDLLANGFNTVVDIDVLGTFNVFRASYPFLVKPGSSLIAITAGQAVRPIANQIHSLTKSTPARRKQGSIW